MNEKKSLCSKTTFETKILLVQNINKNKYARNFSSFLSQNKSGVSSFLFLPLPTHDAMSIFSPTLSKIWEWKIQIIYK